MPEYSTTEIAAKCRVSERTIQRWIKEGLLPVQEIMRNRYLVNDEDIERLKPRTIQAHRDELTQRMDALEARIDALEQAIERLTAKERTRLHRPPRAEYTGGTVQEKQEGPSTLPDGWMPIVDLIKQYNVPETSAMRHMRAYLKTGAWKTHDGRTIRKALDQEGQAEFLRLFGPAAQR